jgi:RNA polymerase sigma-70 factor (ECF subfamily)
MTRAMPLEPDAIPPASGVGLGSAGRTAVSVRVATEEAGELYEAWSARVRGYVRFRVRDASDAEDLVSEVFRRVVTQPMPIESGARPAWIFRVTHNAVIDYYRRRRFPLLPVGFDRPDDAPSLPDRVIHDERVRATDEAMRGLPGRQRAAIYLRYYEDLPYESVASVMGIPAATARSLVHRGLQRLASVLDEETDR